MHQLLLFQLADASLPTGGYAYSNGLEASARLGLIRNQQDFIQYLEDFTANVCSAEIPFLNDCYRIEGTCLGPETITLIKRLDAFLTIPVIHKASIVQGRNWLAASRAVLQCEAIDELESLHREHSLPCHYTTGFGLSLKIAGIDAESTRNLYLYLALRDQISVAVRLGLIGPQYGMDLLAQSLKDSHPVLATSSDLSSDQAHRLGPLQEIAQAWHPNIYSKLFQN